MEINAEKTKLMTDNTSGNNTEIKVNGQKLETVTSFKYLGSVLIDDDSKPEKLPRKHCTATNNARHFIIIFIYEQQAKTTDNR